jgi:O-Antigen ligase
LSEYKYIIFFFMLLIGVPAGILLAYCSKLWEKIIIFLMVFFTCSLAGTINFESVKDYRGTSRGFEIGLVDLATLVIFGMMVLKPKYKLKMFPPGSFLFFIYILFSMLSIQNAANSLYSWFEILKMFKMFFYYMVWYNYFVDLNQIQQVIKTLSVLVIYMFLIVVYQWKMGDYQPNGPFTHQNSLCMYVMTLGGIFLAALFELKMSQFKTVFITGMFGLCSLIELLTLSRAGVVCYAGCCSVVIFFSFTVKFKPKKVFIFMAIFMIGLAGLLFYANSIYNRFMYAPESSMQSRTHLATSAKNMAKDGFFGVGLNNFGIKVNAEYPYSKHHMAEGFKEGLVESIYLMIAAETGWLNMFVFLAFILYFYFSNVRNIYYYRKSKMVYLPIAISGGLAAIFLQSLLEWVLKQSPNFYQMMFFFAIIMAMDKIHKQNAKCSKEELENAELAIKNL